jgi:RimJ/RimL family protein N-acetyltransferase
VHSIETARLILRRGLPSDAAALVEGLGDWAVSEWLINPPFPYSIDDAAEFLKQFDRPIDAFTGPYLIQVRESRCVIGVVGLRAHPDAKELTYWLAKPAHGRGYMHEAVVAYLNAARNAGIADQVFATTDPENHASRMVLERAGFSRGEERMRDAPTRRGATRQLWYRLDILPKM